MEHLFGVSHIEIPAPDLTRGVDFYSKVFEWGIELVTVDHYAFFKIGKTGSGGAFDASLIPAPENTGVQIVIDVEDIAKTLKDIEKNGGIVIRDKTEIPGGHGFYAVFKDPNHNFMQIHARQ